MYFKSLQCFQMRVIFSTFFPFPFLFLCLTFFYSNSSSLPIPVLACLSTYFRCQTSNHIFPFFFSFLFHCCGVMTGCYHLEFKSTARASCQTALVKSCNATYTHIWPGIVNLIPDEAQVWSENRVASLCQACPLRGPLEYDYTCNTWFTVTLKTLAGAQSNK